MTAVLRIERAAWRLMLALFIPVTVLLIPSLLIAGVPWSEFWAASLGLVGCIVLGVLRSRSIAAELGERISLVPSASVHRSH